MRVTFAEFTLDDESRQVRQGDREVRLSPKAFELLATLLHARPRALAKADLHARLWPDTYVTDASLAMLVSEIRDALGDDAKAPRFVRTVQRYGYAFGGLATEVGAGVTAPAPAEETAGSYWLVSPTRQLPLAQGDNLVGRDPHASIWLDLPGISRRHAMIVIEGDRITVEDLGSKNGTHVRGEPVTAPVTINDGDDVRFGTVSLTFRQWSPTATTASEPSASARGDS